MGPRAWNSLPEFVTGCTFSGTFRKYLQTYLYYHYHFSLTEQQPTNSVKRPCSSFPPLTTLCIIDVLFTLQCYVTLSLAAVFDVRCEKCDGGGFVCFPQQRVASAVGKHHERVLSATRTAATDAVHQTGRTVVSGVSDWHVCTAVSLCYIGLSRKICVFACVFLY